MLERALKLRDEEKYLQAQSCLLEAAKTNPEAMYHLSLAYRHGGWCLEKNLVLGSLYLNKSARAGFTLAQIENQTFKGVPITPIEKAYYAPKFESYFELAKEGNEFAQYKLINYTFRPQETLIASLLHKNAAVCSYFGYLKYLYFLQDARELLFIAYKQKCFDHSSVLASILSSYGKHEQALKIAIKSNSKNFIERHVASTNKLQYMVGKWINRSVNPRHKSTTEYIKCLEFYRRVIKKIQSVIYSWSLCAKQLGICKDVTQMISQFVWKLKSKDI